MGTGHIEVEDGRLYYEAAGDGPPVVLLHGGLLDCRMWDDQFELLAGHFRAVRFDARSAGRSSTATGDYRNDDDLQAVLDTLGLDRAALVGLSLGARTACDFAVTRPERVTGLFAASPGISGMTFVDPYVTEHAERQLAAAREGDAGTYVEEFLRLWVDGPGRTAGEVDEGVRVRCADMARNNVTLHATAHGRMLEREAVPRLGEVRAPAVALVGDLDAADILRMADLIVEQVPGARRVDVAGAGHAVNLERPAEFNAALLEFLRSAAG